jgi:hypothetical protein
VFSHGRSLWPTVEGSRLQAARTTAAEASAKTLQVPVFIMCLSAQFPAAQLTTSAVRENLAS